ncbi:response regulator transcription factor [Methylomonas methanica]|uniref:DNA-binding response regulator n=1 Tax=Methylomonas methanica TaxID=421 RepID=A0A177MG54_METMH|nr:response regulator transcription factor [Methylomonas methanica]OAI03789.1 DNA-binding response regulator [Methylomonas methanica]
MANKISVLLVDDHAVVRAGYKTYLSLSERIGAVYEADRGETACQVYDKQTPDVVVMDLSMPGLGGLESVRRLLVRYPHCKILVFSIHNELVYVTRAIKAGAKGYITKNNEPDTLVTAVCTLAEGGTYIEPALAQQLAVNMAIGQDEAYKVKSLSPREFDIFCLLANGLSTRQAAEKLCLSYKTVCNHSTAIKEKLNVKTMSELTLLAGRQGIVKTGNGMYEPDRTESLHP